MKNATDLNVRHPRFARAVQRIGAQLRDAYASARQLQRVVGRRAFLDGRLVAPVGVPQSENLDTACFSVDLVVEVVPGSTQQEPTNALLLGVASTRSNPGLSGDKLEGSLEIFYERQGGGLTIRSPPRRCAPNLSSSAGRCLDKEARSQGLLTEFSEEGLRIDELPARGLLKGLLERSFLFRSELETLIGFGDEDGDGGSFL